ncbi:Sec-independent protein translocase subunit TatA [Rhodococcus sp. BP-252]|uniref:Sec-independent protein translocase protein TatA n=1 Tax=Rhodococcoides kyotonense TaxID=398843 RepID=A0A177YF94_9NOCA|nr:MULTISPECIES: Sec-independent protein translocase subunit TatA [Rhodococcus]MBY6410074.1 Sec-independent protein translocase subunit TatA [Rhodococcus sp. BP-320]MBY6415043.1 Sec-independent protein translocase subunit TatA [Rhodococcus sp. BP-321]MBY6421254.1 Sec-independent protein translocase subunit TatA [Rhodococcus sp. BP-324]MBY6425649.1 Sec-independent protein translocase subunit TatA [Rhodococcus sp. BP-323]MBY6429939.1 Sec-independent protein translocase subunit TatA [Rhodococcus 
MGAMSPWHWAIVALVVVILFGSKKLPDAARGLGRSLRIFKSEVKEMQNDGKSDAPAAPTAAPAQLDSTRPVDAHAHVQPDSKSA